MLGLHELVFSESPSVRELVRNLQQSLSRLNVSVTPPATAAATAAASLSSSNATVSAINAATAAGGAGGVSTAVRAVLSATAPSPANSILSASTGTGTTEFNTPEQLTRDKLMRQLRSWLLARAGIVISTRNSYGVTGIYDTGTGNRTGTSDCSVSVSGIGIGIGSISMNSVVATGGTGSTTGYNSGAGTGPRTGPNTGIGNGIGIGRSSGRRETEQLQALWPYVGLLPANAHTDEYREELFKIFYRCSPPVPTLIHIAPPLVPC